MKFGETRNGFRYWYGPGWLGFGVLWFLSAGFAGTQLTDRHWSVGIPLFVFGVFNVCWAYNAAARYVKARKS